MSFILVPTEGEDLQVNAWNWRPTLALLFAAGAISEADLEVLGCHGCDSNVGHEQADRIADIVARQLGNMSPGQRLLADGSVSSEPKKAAVFSSSVSDGEELYATNFEWLDVFAKFCRSSKGFKVR